MSPSMNCQQCGKLIPQGKGQGRHKKYCDDRCRQRAHRKVKERPTTYCLNCRKRIAKSRRKGTLYCDQKCRDRYQAKQRNGGTE